MSFRERSPSLTFREAKKEEKKEKEKEEKKEKEKEKKKGKEKEKEEKKEKKAKSSHSRDSSGTYLAANVSSDPVLVTAKSETSPANTSSITKKDSSPDTRGSPSITSPSSPPSPPGGGRSASAGRERMKIRSKSSGNLEAAAAKIRKAFNNIT